MASSSCVKCGGFSFEFIKTKPQGSNFYVWFVQCASCGGVVGVLEYDHVGTRTKAIHDDLKKIGTKLGVPLP